MLGHVLVIDILTDDSIGPICNAFRMNKLNYTKIYPDLTNLNIQR